MKGSVCFPDSIIDIIISNGVPIDQVVTWFGRSIPSTENPIGVWPVEGTPITPRVFDVPRLDKLVAARFGLSRRQAQEAVRLGRVDVGRPAVP